MTKDPLPPPTATYSSVVCPTLFPAGISTAVDAEAVAAKVLEKEQIKSSWTLWAERLLTEITMANELQKQDGGAFIPRTYVVDFSQNGDVP